MANLRVVATKLLGSVLNPGTYLGLVLSALLVVLAYQVRPSYDVTVGSPTDGPLLRGFNTPEVMQGSNPLPFRWTTGDSQIVLSGVGRQDFDVTLTVGGTRPPGEPAPTLKVSAGGHELLNVNPAPALVDYSFSVPRDSAQAGDLTLRLTSNAFIPPDDPNPRPLGVVLTRVRVTPGANPDRFIEPVPGLLLFVSATAMLVGLLLALVGWGTGGVALGALLPGLLAACLLVFDRLWLTSGRWYETWPQAVLAGAILVLVAWPVAGWLLKRGGGGWSPLQSRLLLTLLFVAFAVRLAGQFHPEIFIVDLGFHIHRLETVETGQLLFTIKSAEWGGNYTFYLPTAYIFMLPMQWLFNDETLVVKLFTVGIATLGVLPVFFIARKLLGSGRAGLIAAGLYLTMPVAILPMSWGITTNVFGEFFALLALAVAAGMYRRLRPTSPALWLFVVAIFLALLSHPGVVQLAGVALGLTAFLWLVLGRRRVARVAGASTLAGLALASVLAYVFYYTHFAADMLNTLNDIRQQRAAQASGGLHLKVGGSVADASLGLIVRFVDNRRDWLLGGLDGFWREATAYYRVWPVPGAVLGCLFIWPTGRLRALLARRVLVLAALGWGITVLIFALVGWTVNLYVRYSLFLLPIAALGSGVLLDGLWRRGRAGAWTSLLLLAYFLVTVLALWQYRINYAVK